MSAFKIVQIAAGIVLLIMIALNESLPPMQKLAFLALFGIILIDKFIDPAVMGRKGKK